MNGFYLSIGKQGSGKTLFITKLAIDSHLKTKKRLFSNYSLFNVNYTPITFKLRDQEDDRLDPLI